ncbi:MAG: thiamine pyrophosphate-binding protein [Candidatus Lokiarchaeota archaeon]|jgi:acetolactate synthase-like protein
MNGGEIVAKVLKEKDIKYLFTLCGGHISPIIVGAKKEGINVLDVRHEATAVFAADAISRFTGIPGVAVVTAGPGVTNSITALKNAQMAESSLILLGGAVATILKGKGALQDIEQIELLKSVVKWETRIEQDCDIVPIIEEAFDIAQSGIPGPVFIECPIDLLYDESLVKNWYEMAEPEKASVRQKITGWYLRRHVDKLFACSTEKVQIHEGEKVVPFLINEEDIEKVLTQINNVSKPILIIGSQAMINVEEVKRLSEAIKNLGIPVYLTGMARGLLGKNYPLHFHHKRNLALKNADLVILTGMPQDFRLNYGRSINSKAFVIAINRSSEELKKNRKPDLAIQADSSLFLQAVSEEKNFEKHFDEWIAILNEREKLRIDQIKQFENEETKYINPLKLCFEIEKSSDNESIIVVDGGDFIATASYIVKPNAPLRWIDAGPFGTLGAGAGFALAAKLVYPKSEVWLIYGDGAAGYSIAEFDTFVRHKIPIIGIIGNDAGWTQITRDQVKYLRDDVGTRLKYSDYHLVAKGYGAEGLFVNDHSNVQKVLNEAKRLFKEGKTVLINALIGKSKFREGSISM